MSRSKFKQALAQSEDIVRDAVLRHRSEIPFKYPLAYETAESLAEIVWYGSNKEKIEAQIESLSAKKHPSMEDLKAGKVSFSAWSRKLRLMSLVGIKGRVITEGPEVMQLLGERILGCALRRDGKFLRQLADAIELNFESDDRNTHRIIQDYCFGPTIVDERSAQKKIPTLDELRDHLEQFELYLEEPNIAKICRTIHAKYKRRKTGCRSSI